MVLDIAIGTTMLAIFPTAASIQLVSKGLMRTKEHNGLRRQSLKVVGASVEYMLKAPFVDLIRITKC